MPRVISKRIQVMCLFIRILQGKIRVHYLSFHYVYIFTIVLSFYLLCVCMWHALGNTLLGRSMSVVTCLWMLASVLALAVLFGSLGCTMFPYKIWNQGMWVYFSIWIFLSLSKSLQISEGVPDNNKMVYYTWICSFQNLNVAGILYKYIEI
jgi:hypothetical protein